MSHQGGLPGGDDTRAGSQRIHHHARYAKGRDGVCVVFKETAAVKSPPLKQRVENSQIMLWPEPETLAGGWLQRTM